MNAGPCGSVVWLEFSNVLPDKRIVKSVPPTTDSVTRVDYCHANGMRSLIESPHFHFN